MPKLKELLFGSPEKRENVSLLRPGQEGLYNQLVRSGKRSGAGGAFGTSADYYRNLLSDDNEDYDAFSAPALRQYNQDIVPGLSEQFAGMGAGGLNSSGFRNAQIQGATDLSERLGALRANLRQQGAQGLQNIGNAGLQSFSQNMVTQPGTQGFLAPALGSIGSAFTSPALGALGASTGNWLTNKFGMNNSGNSVGANSGPYGSNGPQASPQFTPPGIQQGQGGTRFGPFYESNNGMR